MKFEIGQDRVSVHFLVAYVDGLAIIKRFKEILGTPFCEAIVKVTKERYTSLFSVKGLNELFLFIENNIIDKPGRFYKKIRKKFDKDYLKSVKILSGKQGRNWLNVSAALKSIEYLSIYLPTLRYFEVVAMRHLKKSFQNNNIKISDDEIFTLASVDNYISLVAKEELDLLRIALKYYNDKASKKYIKETEEHTEKYKNIELHVSTRDPLTLEVFKKKLNVLFQKPKKNLLREFNKIKNNNKLLKKEKLDLKRAYRFSKYEKDMLRMVEFISETKVKITDCICLLNSKLVTSARNLSRQWNINEKLFYLMYPEEIRKYSNFKKIDKSDLNKIKKREEAAIWINKDKIKVFFGQKANQFLKNKITEEKIESDEIKGTPIFKGKLKGTVKIVRSMKDFPKIKRGDILVSSDTTPDFIPVFKKISAIITDEGGMICHAAIVAREMKIPCVVGAKIATKILKDDDLVELNAEDGIIKILNKKK